MKLTPLWKCRTHVGPAVMIAVLLCVLYSLVSYWTSATQDLLIGRRIEALGGEVRYHDAAPHWMPRWTYAQYRLFDRVEFVGYINGPIPKGIISDLHRLKHIKYLIFADTDLRNEDLEQVGRLTSLRYLDLSRTQIDDAGLIQLNDLKWLTLLSLDETAVGDGAINAILNMNALRTLSLDGTRITDKGLLELARLESLKGLRVSNTAVSDPGIQRFRSQLNDSRNVSIHTDE